MSSIIDIFVPLEALHEPIEVLVSRALGRRRESIGPVRVVRRSLDARKQRRVGYQLRVEVAEPGKALGETATQSAPRRMWPAGVPIPKVVIVGSGPAGAWAALRLAESGVPSTIVERGNDVQTRRRDLAELHRGRLNVESNYCFGEGGAGAYSDGKLYTRSKDREGTAAVLGDLVRLGAPHDIEIDSRPHIGSNRLPRILVSLREHLQRLGVTYHFGCELTGIRSDRNQVRAALVSHGEIPADIVVLATGHSARSVYEWAAATGIALERKDIAIGVRLEHPQRAIDVIQYGRLAGDPRLPPAFYEVAGTVGGRGVYSFCMCPGGWVVPAATESDGVVVNGMSLAKRDSPFANAAIVVTTTARDFGSDSLGPLAGIAFQRKIEQAAFARGGGGFKAPAQGLMDFLGGVLGRGMPKTSYRPGVQHARLDEVLPGFITAALREGLNLFGRRLTGFLREEATLIGVETRTSAPVRILRDPISLESPSLSGLYPAGEGAGFAGGIVSSALDGARVADAIIARGQR